MSSWKTWTWDVKTNETEWKSSPCVETFCRLNACLKSHWGSQLIDVNKDCQRFISRDGRDQKWGGKAVRPRWLFDPCPRSCPEERTSLHCTGPRTPDGSGTYHIHTAVTSTLSRCWTIWISETRRTFMNQYELIKTPESKVTNLFLVSIEGTNCWVSAGEPDRRRPQTGPGRGLDFLLVLDQCGKKASEKNDSVPSALQDQVVLVVPEEQIKFLFVILDVSSTSGSTCRSGLLVPGSSRTCLWLSSIWGKTKRFFMKEKI